MAGSADAGAGGGGDAGAGGESAQCAPGYIDVGGVCESACAPRDLDGASIVLEHGHTDLIGAAYENAQLQLFVSDDSSPIRREPALHRLPESVLIHGKPTSQLEVPDIPALAGLLEPGTTVWLFPEGQPEAEEKDLVWPGFQAYGVAADVFQGDKVVVRLLEHDGSGRFVGFGTVQDELTPPEVFFNPSANVDEHDLNAGTHRHMAWTFTESGLHRLRFELEGNLLGGGSVKSLAHTYRFFLGELSDLPETEPTVLVAHPGEPSYAVGADLSMTAERYGMSSSLPLAWARQCYVNDNEPGAWEPLGTSETLTTKAVGLCQYVACLMDGSRVAVISQPVAPSIQ
jgi:surface-anchored protein